MINFIRKLFSKCEHEWLNKSQENTSDIMVAPSQFVTDYNVEAERIKREIYLGTTIKDICGNCGEVRIDQTKERVVEIELKQKEFLNKNPVVATLLGYKEEKGA